MRLAGALLLVCLSGPVRAAEFVWWEGEAAAETNFPKESPFAASTFADRRDLLSGGDWLTNAGPRSGPEAYARWTVAVPAAGAWELWCRKFWKHGPFRWRFDDGAWRTCPFDVALADGVDIRTHLGANWVGLGRVDLPAGEHVFEIRLLAGEGENLTAAFDCFTLVRGMFAPRGRLKPGQKSGGAEAGRFAWEPEADPFGTNALLDLRGLNESVAGRHGFVRRDRDRFVLGDGRPVRFWGVNAGGELTGLPREQVDYLARRLAKSGVNMVRVLAGMFDSEPPSGPDPAKIDRLLYFVSAMKREGIYVTISGYFPLFLTIKPGHGIAGFEDAENKTPFALIYFHQPFQALYRSWLKATFTTKSPYTGLPLARDPAVAIVELVNEDSLFFWTFTPKNVPPARWRELEKKFGAWLGTRYGSVGKARTAWLEAREPGDDAAAGVAALYDAWHMTGDALRMAGPGKQKRVADQARFLAETQRSWYADTVRWLRRDLGVRSLMAASNWTTADPARLDAVERWTYTAGDVIDRHGYFEAATEAKGHEWQVRVGDAFTNRSALKAPDDVPLPVVQDAGYPHTISEIGWTQPNRWRADYPFLAAAYASLQGLDGLDTFALGGADWDGRMEKWALSDPVILGNFPAYALAYRRGDIAEGPVVVTQSLARDEVLALKAAVATAPQAPDAIRAREVPVTAAKAGDAPAVDPAACYVGRVVRAVGAGPSRLVQRDLTAFLDRANKSVRSATGELAWDWGRGIATIDTPRAQAAAGFLSQQAAITLSTAVIECENDYATVAVVSLDGEPLASSRRILVQAMTNAFPTGFKASAGADGRIDDLGRPPLQVERIRARVTLALQGGAAPAVTPLDEHGYARDASVAILPGEAGRWSFALDGDSVYHVLTR